MGILKKTYDWLELRLQLEAPVKDAALHPVPRNTASWWYVFGSAAFTLLILQVVTGILLALVYVPSAGNAWSSLNALNHQLDLGWFLRAVHGWGSNFMVAVVLIHMAQVFMFGSYKYPRELTWIVGVFLLLDDSGHGIHWPGAAVRSGRLLGIGHWRVDHEPDSLSSAEPWFTCCLADRSSPEPHCLDSLPCMYSLYPACCSPLLVCTSGWCSSSVSMNGRCPVGLLGGLPIFTSTRT